MTKAQRLEPLADLAGVAEADAARRLAAAVKAMQLKEAELEQLRSYLAEYRQRAEQDAATGSERWRNTRVFLAKLSDAVAYQEAELAKAVERYRADADRWRHSHQRAQALDKVVERAQREAGHAVRQREQAELDELALRRTLQPAH
jgi:flagellar export protein FliJ